MRRNVALFELKMHSTSCASVSISENTVSGKNLATNFTISIRAYALVSLLQRKLTAVLLANWTTYKWAPKDFVFEELLTNDEN